MAGRPREFDEDEVLDRALDAFWTHGYKATSVTHLVEATGLAKGSLYKAFGDKRRLFELALDRYLESGVGRLRTVAAGESPRAALERWLMNIIELSTCTGVRRGCMAINCTVELAPHDEGVRARLRRHQRGLEQIYARLISAGISAGEFRAGLDPKVSARWLTTIIGGLQVRGKLGLDRKDALETVRMTLAGLS